MLKVYFDLQILNFQKYGGISSYFYNLISNFFRYPEIGVKPILSENKKSIYFLSKIKFDFPEAFIEKTDLSNYFLPKKNIKNNFDLIHFSYYHPNINLFNNTPKISTVHDFIPEIEFSRFSKNRYLHSFKKLYLHRSNGLIYVSNTTKSVAENLHPALKIKPNKVIHHGVDLPNNPHVSTKWSDSNFFLFIGKRSLYKNFDSILPGFRLLTKNNDVHLYCYGGGKFSKQETKRFENLGISNKVFYIDPNSHKLHDLLAFALALINPSINEGFGMANLEALASGCKILCSDIPIFREVLQEHATFFNPTDYWSIFNALKHNDKVNQSLSTCQGIDYVSKYFSWKDKAIETAAFYSSVLKNN